jgi:hypothetical protein
MSSSSIGSLSLRRIRSWSSVIPDSAGTPTKSPPTIVRIAVLTD